MNSITLSVNVKTESGYGIHENPDYPKDNVLVKLQADHIIPPGHYLITGYIVDQTVVAKDEKEFPVALIVPQTFTEVSEHAVVNSLVFAGRLGNDPWKNGKQGKQAVTRISVANDNGKNEAGENKPATWLNVAVFGPTGNAVAEYTRKGNFVVVSGVLKPCSMYESKEGRNVAKLEAVGFRCEFGGSGNGQRRQPVDLDIASIPWAVLGEEEVKEKVANPTDAPF